MHSPLREMRLYAAGIGTLPDQHVRVTLFLQEGPYLRLGPERSNDARVRRPYQEIGGSHSGHVPKGNRFIGALGLISRGRGSEVDFGLVRGVSVELCVRCGRFVWVFGV
jgi:hypothetical protein